MIKTLSMLVVALTVAGCSTTTAGGVRGEVAFRATGDLTEFVSALPPHEVAACFERDATLLPFSKVSHDPVDGSIVYRLRYRDMWFEQIVFRSGAEGGSVIELTSSGKYDGGWTAMLVRDRLDPLGRCMGPRGGVEKLRAGR